jgi:single-stranded-DNA-specific exonuclease
MAGEKRWIFLDAIEVPRSFQDAIGGHPLVAQALYQRGYRTIESARAFLDPDLYQPASPFDLPDLDIACDLLAKAIRDQARILVWGDFDVDGQTATTVLVEGLRELGAQVGYHIPVRARESHGIRKTVLKNHIAQGFDLLLTCDTGITEHESLQLARNLDIPVIVTDHHLLGERLPPANAVINPQRLDEAHPLHSLPGVGVAYQLMAGLYAFLGGDHDPGKLLELVALGIVADVADLKGDTRYLLQKGLTGLRNTERLGLNVLYENADLIPANLNEGHIGFQIAPRLNAVGRLGDANPMVEFLTTDDPGRARQLANMIEGMNIKRRADSRQVAQGAETQLLASSEDRHSPAIILHHPSWPGGVVGIVASRLVERNQKPVILLTGDDPIHGSARSVPGLHITQAIAAQADLLNGYGGHPMAAGLSMPAAHYQAFKRRFFKTVEAMLPDEAAGVPIEIAQSLAIEALNLSLVVEISRLAPFGPGNPPLHFLLRALRLISETQVGVEREHRQVTVVDPDDHELRLIWWNGADEPLPDAQFDLVCKLSQSDFKGVPQLSAEWVDFRLSEAGQIELEARQVEIVDFRDREYLQVQLTQCLLEVPHAQVWGEGELPKEFPFKGRHELGKTLHLILWTLPPSQSVLRHVLHQTQPQKVTVFGIDPQIDDVDNFMARLGGAAKHVITHLGGEVAFDKLAAVCAADEGVIHTGLLLWQARGKLKVKFEGGSVCISTDVPEPNLQAIEQFETLLKNLLAESRAYRRYFRKGDLQTIITR